MYILHSTCTTNSWALLVRPATGTFNLYVMKNLQNLPKYGYGEMILIGIFLDHPYT